MSPGDTVTLAESPSVAPWALRRLQAGTSCHLPGLLHPFALAPSHCPDPSWTRRAMGSGWSGEGDSGCHWGLSSRDPRVMQAHGCPEDRQDSCSHPAPGRAWGETWSW